MVSQNKIVKVLANIKKLLLKVSKMAYFRCLQNDFFYICL